MKEITPIKIFLFIVITMLSLGLISFLIPEDGIKITDSFSIKAPNLKNTLTQEKPEYADISNIITDNNQTDSLVAVVSETTVKPKQKKIDTIRANAGNLRKAVHKIEFSADGKKRMNNFFKKLKSLSELDTQVRIWHFGDSQIEGERITGFIRERLQEQFGGYGPGLLPVSPVAQKLSWNITASEEWKRYTLFGRIDTTVKHRNYGPLMTFFRFQDFSGKDTSCTKARFTVRNSNMGVQHSRKYETFKLIYGNADKTFKLKVSDRNEKIIFDDNLPPSYQISSAKINQIKGYNLLNLEVECNESPDIYGFSLETPSGIIMDNLTLRGSAGLFFTKTNKNHLKKMFELFNVNLIIFQFGVNVVSDKVDNYGYYKVRLIRQFKRIKEIAPDIPVIVIGVSDRAKKVGTYYESMESVTKVRDVQKQAALESGYAFWDLYEAMGGKNSMPSWVFAKPPLAGKDFIHFNNRGARIISHMFYNALISEYNIFLKSQDNTENE